MLIQYPALGFDPRPLESKYHPVTIRPTIQLPLVEDLLSIWLRKIICKLTHRKGLKDRHNATEEWGKSFRTVSFQNWNWPFSAFPSIFNFWADLNFPRNEWGEKIKYFFSKKNFFSPKKVDRIPQIVKVLVWQKRNFRDEEPCFF